MSSQHGTTLMTEKIFTALPLEIFHFTMSFLPKESVMAIGLTCKLAYYDLVPSVIQYKQLREQVHGGVQHISGNEQQQSTFSRIYTDVMEQYDFRSPRDHGARVEQWRLLRLLERDTPAQYANYYRGRLCTPSAQGNGLVAGHPEKNRTKKDGPLIELLHDTRSWHFGWSDLYRVMQRHRGLALNTTGLAMNRLRLPVSMTYERYAGLHGAACSRSFGLEPRIHNDELYFRATHRYVLSSLNEKDLPGETWGNALSVRKRERSCKHMQPFLFEQGRNQATREADRETMRRLMMARAIKATAAEKKNGTPRYKGPRDPFASSAQGSNSENKASKRPSTTSAATIEHWVCGHCHTETTTTVHCHNRQTIEIVVEVYQKLGRCEDPTEGFWNDAWSRERRRISMEEHPTMQHVFPVPTGQSSIAASEVKNDSRCGRRFIYDNDDIIMEEPERKVILS